MPLTYDQAFNLALYTAIATAVLTWGGHLLVAHLHRGGEEKKFFREKLLDRYSEFVAVAAADLDRAKTLEAGFVFSASDAESAARLSEIDSKRHSLRLDLLRLSLQIRLLEPDPALAARVEALAKAQPFLHPGGQYHERLEALSAGVKEFERQLMELVAALLAKRAARLKATHPKSVSD